MRYFLSLGSNLGDRMKNILQALAFLEEKGAKIVNSSSLYKTQPVDFPSQLWFFNQVVEVEAKIDPFDFIDLIKKIERKMGRKTGRPKGPRIIDIDILLAGEMVIQTKELKIPHPRMEKRNFVLVPFKEISAETLHPILKEKIENLWKKSKDDGIVRKIYRKGHKNLDKANKRGIKSK